VQPEIRIRVRAVDPPLKPAPLFASRRDEDAKQYWSHVDLGAEPVTVLISGDKKFPVLRKVIRSLSTWVYSGIFLI
jgi:hypothetical protein